MLDDGTYYEVICSPVRDRPGSLRQVAAVVVNETLSRRQQKKLNAIDLAGRELVRLEYDSLSKRDASQRLELLRDRIIRFSRDVLKFQHFAVLLLNEKTNRLQEVISEGLMEDEHVYELLASTEGNGICGYVAATGRSYICPDVHRDERYLSGMHSSRSSLTVPLRLHDKVIGVLNVESDKVGAFREEDRQFAEIFSNYVALAMNILNLLVSERHTTHTQLTGSMSVELAGPLNDIITEAGELMEDYIGHDDLRRRLSVLIDRATRLRHSVQQWTESSSAGVLPGLSSKARHDPLLAGKSILVVDDEKLIRNTIRDVLIPCGCEVDTAEDGRQAKQLIVSKRYDLVISDIKMPYADGYEVFAAAKAAHADTQVILVTGFGYDPNHSVVRAAQGGLAAVLMKPFKVDHLLDECRSAFSSKSE